MNNPLRFSASLVLCNIVAMVGVLIYTESGPAWVVYPLPPLLAVGAIMELYK